MHRTRNFTPETFAAARRPKRSRSSPYQTIKSCLRCRTFKIACDREQPCGNCLRQPAPGDCLYDSPDADDADYHVLPSKASNVKASPPTADPSPTRKRLRADGSSLDCPDPSLSLRTNSNNTHSTRSASLSTAGSKSRGALEDRDQEQETDSTSLTNSDPRGLLTSKEPSKVFYIGESAWTSVRNDACIIYNRQLFGSQWHALCDLCVFFPNWQSQSILDSVHVGNATSDPRTSLVAAIPERDECNILIQRYLITFNTIHPVVNVKAFQKEVEQFWQRKDDPSVAWLGLFLAVLALGYQLPVIPMPSGKTFVKRRKHGRLLMAQVRDLVFTHPQTRTARPDITLFQVLVLLILDQSLLLDRVDGSDAKNGMMSIARCMAFTMGLHREQSSAPGMTVEDKDLRRQLWSTFTFLDLEHSVQSGMPFVLWDKSFDPSRSLNAHSKATKYQALLRHAMQIWGDVSHLANSSAAMPSRGHVFDLQDALDEIDFQSALDPEEDPSQRSTLSSRIRCAIFDCFNLRMKIVLHRLRRLRKDQLGLPVGNESRQIALDSALATLNHQDELTRLIEEQPPSTANAWAHFVFSQLHCNFFYSATYVVALLHQLDLTDLRHSKGKEENQNPQTLLQVLHRLTPLMDRCMTLSPWTVKEHAIIHAFMHGVEERIRLGLDPASASDKFDDDNQGGSLLVRHSQDAMYRTVERAKILIAEAQQTDDPPPALNDNPGGGWDLYQQAFQSDPASQGFDSERANPAFDMGWDIAMSDWNLDLDLFADLGGSIRWDDSLNFLE